MADDDDKTEDPTEKRKSKAKSEGQIGKSTEFGQVMGMIASFLAIQYLSAELWQDIQLICKAGFSPSALLKEPMTIQSVHTNFLSVAKMLLPDILLLMAIAGLTGALSIALQTKFHYTTKNLKPKFAQVFNVLSGLKKLISINNLVNLLKAVAKLAIIGPMGYFTFVELFPEFLSLINIPVDQMLTYTADAMHRIFWKIIAVLFLMAIFDVYWQKRQNYKKLKMSKQEVKDEAKQYDESNKRKIQAKGFQRARERMMSAVPQANVVVTNPTHYAVALMYDLETGSAPQVVAKGKGYIALKIREIAKENGVPVVERKSLARALFDSVEVGQEIPYELFRAVAELLAYVYRLGGQNPFKR